MEDGVAELCSEKADDDDADEALGVGLLVARGEAGDVGEARLNSSAGRAGEELVERGCGRGFLVGWEGFSLADASIFRFLDVDAAMAGL